VVERLRLQPEHSQEKHSRAGVEEGLGGCDGRLEIASQPPIAVEPGEKNRSTTRLRISTVMRVARAMRSPA